MRGLLRRLDLLDAERSAAAGGGPRGIAEDPHPVAVAVVPQIAGQVPRVSVRSVDRRAGAAQVEPAGDAELLLLLLVVAVLARIPHARRRGRRRFPVPATILISIPVPVVRPGPARSLLTAAVEVGVAVGVPAAAVPALGDEAIEVAVPAGVEPGVPVIVPPPDGVDRQHLQRRRVDAAGAAAHRALAEGDVVPRPQGAHVSRQPEGLVRLMIADRGAAPLEGDEAVDLPLLALGALAIVGGRFHRAGGEGQRALEKQGEPEASPRDPIPCPRHPAPPRPGTGSRRVPVPSLPNPSLPSLRPPLPGREGLKALFG